MSSSVGCVGEVPFIAMALNL